MRLAFALWLAILSTHHSAQAQTFFSLRSLKDASVRSLDLEHLQRPTLFMIFQSECSACQLQVRDLLCLQNKYEVILIGAYSSEKLLRQEYRRMGRPYESYLGEDTFLKALKTKQGLTPELFVYNKKDTKHLLGLTPCAEIAQK